MCIYRFRRCRLLLILCLMAAGASGKTGWSPAPAGMNIEGLGKGIAELNGPWQFHIGDNLQWAQPAIEDAAGQGGWETSM